MSNFKVSDADKGEIRVVGSHQEQTGFFCLIMMPSLTKEINKQLKELG
jgi:hypothetical protein